MPKRSRPDLRPAAAKTVDELEGFAPPPTGAPEPVRAARRVPVGQLGARDALLLLDSGQGTRYVVARAVELLAADPWLWAEYHDGDLLAAVLELEPARWPGAERRGGAPGPRGGRASRGRGARGLVRRCS